MKSIILSALLAISMGALAQDKPKCSATTKAGVQCHAKAKPGSTYCGTHDPNVSRCGFKKKNGEACRLRVKVAGTLCHHHKG